MAAAQIKAQNGSIPAGVRATDGDPAPGMTDTNASTRRRQPAAGAVRGRMLPQRSGDLLVPVELPAGQSLRGWVGIASVTQSCIPPR